MYFSGYSLLFGVVCALSTCTFGEKSENTTAEKKGTIRIAGPWHSESALDRNIDPAEDSYVKKIISSNEGLNFNKDMAEAGEEFEANGIDDFYDKSATITYEINGHEIPVHLKPKIQPQSKTMFPEYVKELPTATATADARHDFQLGEVPNKPNSMYSSFSSKDLPEYDFKDSPSVGDPSTGDSGKTKLHFPTAKTNDLKLPWKFADSSAMFNQKPNGQQGEERHTEEVLNNADMQAATQGKMEGTNYNNAQFSQNQQTGRQNFKPLAILNENAHAKNTDPNLVNSKTNAKMENGDQQTVTTMSNEVIMNSNANVVTLPFQITQDKTDAGNVAINNNVVTSNFNGNSFNSVGSLGHSVENKANNNGVALGNFIKNNAAQSQPNIVANSVGNNTANSVESTNVANSIQNTNVVNKVGNNNFVNNIGNKNVAINIGNANVANNVANKNALNSVGNTNFVQLNSGVVNSVVLSDHATNNNIDPSASLHTSQSANNIVDSSRKVDNELNAVTQAFFQNKKEPSLNVAPNSRNTEMSGNKLKGFMAQENSAASPLVDKLESLHDKISNDNNVIENVTTLSEQTGDEKTKAKARILSLLGELTTKLKGMEAAVTEHENKTVVSNNLADVFQDKTAVSVENSNIVVSQGKPAASNDDSNIAVNPQTTNAAAQVNDQAVQPANQQPSVEKTNSEPTSTNPQKEEIGQKQASNFIESTKNSKPTIFVKFTPNNAVSGNEVAAEKTASDKSFDEAVQRGVTERIKSFMKEGVMKSRETSNTQALLKRVEPTIEEKPILKTPLELPNNKPFIMNTDAIDYQGGMEADNNDNYVAELPTSVSAASDATPAPSENSFSFKNNVAVAPSNKIVPTNKMNSATNAVAPTLKVVPRTSTKVRSDTLQTFVKNFQANNESKNQKNTVSNARETANTNSFLQAENNIQSISKDIQKELVSLEETKITKLKEFEPPLEEDPPEETSQTTRTFKPKLDPDDIEYPDYNEVKDASIFETALLRKRYHANKIEWSDPLSDKAQKQAELLARDPAFDIKSAERLPGENIAMVKLNSANVGKDAVDAWANQVKDYDFKSPLVTRKNADFVQLMWKSEKKFGIGVAKSRSDKGWLVTSFYDTPSVDHYIDLKNNVQSEKPVSDPYSDIV